MDLFFVSPPPTIPPGDLIQPYLVKRELFKRDFSLSGTHSFAFPPYLQITWLKRDFVERDCPTAFRDCPTAFQDCPIAFLVGTTVHELVGTTVHEYATIRFSSCWAAEG
jgi:hypothetical protein